MSATREILDEQAKSLKTTAKIVKMMCWGVIILGLLACLTIIGIPFGIMMLIAGGLGLKFIPKMLEKKSLQAQAAFAEAAEIHEHNLRQARSSKDQL
jgi:uncharacterized membrane protein YccF (DUF307 family)